MFGIVEQSHWQVVEVGLTATAGWTEGASE
jgi:hypothetical protein